MPNTSLRFVIAGQLKRDFALIPNGKAMVDVAGGNVVYAAAGFGVWEPTNLVGLLARVGEDYPREWLVAIQKRGFDIHIFTLFLPQGWVAFRNFRIATLQFMGNLTGE